MQTILMGVFLILHGLVHLLYAGQSRRLFELRPGMLWPDGSWLFSKLLGEGTTRLLASILLSLAALGFLAAGLGIFIQQDWWHPAVFVGGLFGTRLALSLMAFYNRAHERFKAKPYSTILFVFLLAVSVFRIYYIQQGPLDLSPDEAHYWEWSRRLDWSYYSKGPMIAYLIYIGTAILGDNVFGIRVMAVVFSALSSVFIYALGKNMYDERVGLLSAILLQIIPLFSTFGIIFTIDSPFINSSGYYRCFCSGG